MRESELEQISSALSSVPTRASQTIAVGAAAVGFLTSSAVVGDLGWFARLAPSLQSTILWMGGAQVLLVVIALCLVLSMAPPDTVGLYQGPSLVITITERRSRWRRLHHAQVAEPAQPIGFAAEASEMITAIAGNRLVAQADIDEYMAMIAFLRATEDSDLLHRRRKRVSVAAAMVAASALLGGAILFVAVDNRLNAATQQRTEPPPKTVIIHGGHPDERTQVVPSETDRRSDSAPSQRGNAGHVQRQSLQTRRTSH